MKTKIIFITISVIFLLLLLPSISAVEFNIVADTNKKSLLNKIQNIATNYIDFKAIAIIVLTILTCMLMETTPNVFLLISVLGLTLVVIYEFISGTEVVDCNKVNSSLIMSLTAFIVALEGKLISSKLLLQVVGGATFMIGLIITLILSNGYY